MDTVKETWWRLSRDSMDIKTVSCFVVYCIQWWNWSRTKLGTSEIDHNTINYQSFFASKITQISTFLLNSYETTNYTAWGKDRGQPNNLDQVFTECHRLHCLHFQLCQKLSLLVQRTTSTARLLFVPLILFSVNTVVKTGHWNLCWLRHTQLGCPFI